MSCIEELEQLIKLSKDKINTLKRTKLDIEIEIANEQAILYSLSNKRCEFKGHDWYTLDSIYGEGLEGYLCDNCLSIRKELI